MKTVIYFLVFYVALFFLLVSGKTNNDKKAENAATSNHVTKTVALKW